MKKYIKNLRYLDDFSSKNCDTVRKAGTFLDFRNFNGENEINSSQISNETTNGFRMNHPHWHPHYEVVIICSSVLYTLINNSKTITSDHPAVYIHRPYTVHMMRTADDRSYSRSVLRFDNQLISGFSREIVDFSNLIAADFTCIYPDETEMSELFELSVKIKSLKCDHSSAQLYIALLLRRLSVILESGRGESFSGGITYIQDVMRMIAENLAEPMTIEELSSRFGVGQSKFYSDFKRHTGSTYKKFLTDLRMTRARELLSSGSGIISAAYETGYSSEAHFIAAFRNYWGETPGTYMRMGSQDFPERTAPNKK